MTSRQSELAAVLENTRTGLTSGLIAEFETAWTSIGTKMSELQSALKEWQGTAEAEVSENVTELTKVVEALREKIVYGIEELKAQGVED